MDYDAVMERISRPHILIIGAASILLAQLVQAQTKVIKETNATPSVTYTGAELFKQYCAVCHGADGRGNGPAVDALKVKPGDITQLNTRNNGKFPQGRVHDMIVGDQMVSAHGTKDMPMWGDVFRSISPNESFKEMRITNLVLYIQSIQK
jgi:mono/diheme cytochrome c family protein